MPLVGKFVELKKPIAVLQYVDGTGLSMVEEKTDTLMSDYASNVENSCADDGDLKKEYLVQAIITRKILFDTRP